MTPDQINETHKKDPWHFRRRVVFSSLFYIGATVSYIIWKGTDTVLYQQISVALIGAGTMVIGSYVFGAVWDDRNKLILNKISEIEDINSKDIKEFK